MLHRRCSSLPWPAGSGLLASLYITAVGTLCTMWQERLPYSVGGATTAGVSSAGDGLNRDGDGSNADTTATAAHAAAAAAAGVDVLAVAGVTDKDAGGSGSGSGKVSATVADDVVAVRPSSPPPCSVQGGDEDPDLPSAKDGETGSGSDGPGAGEDSSGGGSASSPADEEHGGGDTVVAAATESCEHRPEGGAGPEREKSWLDVGGVLGTDDLYLRNPAYLEGDCDGLLGGEEL